MMKTKVLAMTFLFLFAIGFTARASEFFNSPLAVPPGWYNGTGGSNTAFTVLDATASTNGSVLQLGLSAIWRFIGPITPTVNDYVVPVGGDPANGGDAYWDFSFSANTNSTGVFSGDMLDAYTYQITIFDENTLQAFAFDPLALPDNSYYGTGGKTMTKNTATEFGFQNSENLSFGFLPGFNPNALDTYQITLRANPLDGITQDPDVVIQVTPGAQVPEPASFFLIGGGGLLIIGRLKLRRAKPTA